MYLSGNFPNEKHLRGRKWILVISYNGLSHSVVALSIRI